MHRYDPIFYHTKGLVFVVSFALVAGGWLWWLPHLLPSVQAQDSGPTPTPAPTSTPGATANLKKNPEEYNYLPLTFNKGTQGDLRTAIIEGMVFQQGYEVKCAAPQWKIKPKLFGEWKKWFETQGDVMIAEAKSGGDTYEVQMTHASVPMLRGSEDYDKTTKVSSLEAFFGAVNPALPAGEANSSGVVQNLLTLGQQCKVKMDNMDAIDDICSTLDGGSTCYLDRPIPQTDLTMLKLRGILKNAHDTYLMQTAGKIPEDNFCDAFTQPAQHNSLLFGLSETDQHTYATALSNAPIDVENLYRIAFLVVAPKKLLDTGTTADPALFWFNQINDHNKIVKESPIVVAFKVPDFTMNKSLKYTIQDSGQITNRLLKTNELNKEEIVAARNMRDSKFKKVRDARDTSFTDPKTHIYCPDLAECPRIQVTDNQVLRQALYDIVNGLAPDPSCDGIGGYIEEAGQIKTSANISDEKKTFNANTFQTFLPPNSRTNITQDDKQLFDWKLTVTEDEAKKTGGDIKDPDKTVEVNAWIISPSGVDLDQFQAALKAFFSPSGFEAMMKYNCPPDAGGACGVAPERYPFKSGDPEPIANFNSSSKTYTWTIPGEPLVCHKEKKPDPAFPDDPKKRITVEVCELPEHHAGLGLVENKDQLGIRGAYLGWLVRKIEETIRPIDVQIKCTRTEDLFLGKCKVVPLDTSGTNQDVPSSLLSCPVKLGFDPEAEPDKTILTNVLRNKEDWLKEIKTNFPNTAMTDELFDYVISYSEQNGWNPALVLALGREETAWGGVGDTHWMGCMAGDPSGLTDPKEHAKQQMDCLFLNFDTGMSCTHWECKYGPGVDAEQCLYSGKQSTFPIHINYYYRQIVAPYVPPEYNLSLNPPPAQ